MIHICHFISSRGLGRGEFYIDLVNEMSKNIGVKISLLIPKEAKFLHRVSKNINIIEYKSKDSRNNPFLYYELFNIFRLNRFDLVHTHFAKSSEIFYRLNKFFKITHVATKHNPRKGSIFNKIKNVTAVSNDVAKSIKNKKVKVIYNGILKRNIDNKLKVNDRFTIRAIGRLEKIKGFDVLICEMSKIKLDYNLEIVGDGIEYNNLNKLINELNLSNKIKLVGFKENIPELINSSDLIIISSLSEGFSLVALETIIYGKLLISTNVGICKEVLPKKFIIEDSSYSLNIEDIIKNYDLYKNEFDDFLNTLDEKFNLENIVEEYLSYYKKVLN